MLEKIRAEIQKVLDKERDFTSENAKAQALALFWCLELIDKYEEQEPREDAVSRQAAKNQIGRWIGYIDQDMINRICISLDALPSVQPKQKTGRWVYKDMEGQFCSECDEQTIWKFKFCPNCGARMVDE